MCGSGSVRRILGQVDGVVLVEVPPLRAGHIRVMGVDERRNEQERPPVTVARQVVDVPHGGLADLGVVIELVGGERLARLRQAVHVVVPLADPVAGGVPVGRPGEVGGIDVGREALLEAVQLVGPHEVHLPREHRAVAGEPEVVHEGRHRGRELRGVVPGADLGGRPPGQHREPGRRAQRRGAVGRVEARPALGEGIQGGRAHERMAVGAGEVRRQLIRHDQQDVGLPHRRESTPGPAQPTVAAARRPWIPACAGMTRLPGGAGPGFRPPPEWRGGRPDS